MIKEIIKYLVLYSLAATLVLMGVLSTVYAIVNNLEIATFFLGIGGIYILSPAIQAWYDIIWYFFNQDKES